MPIAIARRQSWVGRTREIAEIGDGEPAACECALDAGNAQRFGPHGGAAIARSNIGGCTDQCYGARGLAHHEPASAVTSDATRAARAGCKAPNRSLGSCKSGIKSNARAPPLRCSCNFIRYRSAE